ncbi:MAG TPA: hypothetical protein VF868_17075 [Bacteroidia bacterium]|jgi:hypothetical protein
MLTKYKYLFFVLAGALLLMFDAFYNGFPLVYSDTSTYLASGFELETPFDRPITYGLFLRITSLDGLTLWLTVFIQALITSYLIFQTSQLILGDKIFLKTGLAIIGILSFFTGLSWTVCQLIPDIFTSIALLLVILILFGNFNLKKNIWFYFLFLLAVAMHMSHLLLFFLIITSIFLFRKRFIPQEQVPKLNLKSGMLLMLIAASILTMGSALSKSKHIFFMGAMVEHGILKKYLDENCGTHEYKLCRYKDSLPDKAYLFIWEKETSPLYKMGSWNDVKPEFNEIIHATLTQPGFIGMHIRASAAATLDQLLKFGINDGNGSFPAGTVLHERIAKYCPNDLDAYNHSKQSEGRLNFTDSWNILFMIITLLSLALIIILPGGIRSIFKTTAGNILFIIIAAILLNAWDCGTFANAIDRLGCKMIWLLPMSAGLIVTHHLQRKKPLSNNLIIAPGLFREEQISGSSVL